MENFHHYNKKLKGKARKLRANATRAENHLWYEVLSNRRMLGYKFLRQRPVNTYIADFMCKELNLIIEIDGKVHEFEEVFEKDLEREQHLETLGFIVLRFSNWEVLNKLHLVVEILETWIKCNAPKNSD
jgi:very-short-patch-repair endonuclease